MSARHPRRRTLRQLLGGRLPRRDDDAGALEMLLLVILVGATLGGLMMSQIINQTGSTRFDASRVIALDAAQTGIDVMLGEIRDSIALNNDGSVSINPTTGGAYGDDGQLPCGTITGKANGTGAAGTSQATYSTSVSYYVTNPSTAGATPMSVCAPGYGPYDAVSSSHTPRYAVITSTGTTGTSTSSTTRGRTLVTTYVFQTDDVNVSGGTIKIYPNGSGSYYCMDAGSATPPSGTVVQLQVCSVSSPPAAQQVFAYRSDLSIQLVSSVTTTYANGLCLDTSPTSHAAGDAIVLTPCSALGSAPWNQQWSVDDNAHLRGATTDGTNTDGYCINAPAQVAGQALNLQGCAGSVTDTAQTWVPAPTAGAGMAGAGNKQLVNYQQFATCVDVTGTDVNSPFLILYTCKQNPNPNNVLWNQKFAPSPALGSATAGPTRVLLQTNPGSVYCLTSPLSNGGYVTVTTPCPANTSSTTSGYVWTMYQTKAANGADLPYAQKYIITDNAGLCLSAGPTSDTFNSVYYKVVVATCDGGTEQKWNANPSVLAARVTNTKEN